MNLKKSSPFERFYLNCIVVAVIGPFLPLIIASFAFRWHWPNLWPSEWWWQARKTARLPLAWDYVFSPHSQIIEAIFNTIIIALLVTVICLIVSLPAAKVIAQEDFWGKGFIEFFLLTPLIVPEIAVGLGILITFIQLNLVSSYLGIIMAHLIPCMPYMIRVLTAVFQGLNRGYEEQARALGATPLTTLWRITIPMILPGVIAGSLFTFLVSGNIFLLTFFVGRGSIDTLATLLFAKLNSGAALDPVSAAIALLASVPGIVLLVITESFIKEEIFAKGF